jgi:predicted CXXCH cytochrome family protein
MKVLRLLLLLPLILFGCSQATKNEGACPAGQACASAALYSYPHPAHWQQNHVRFYAQNGAQIEGSGQDCQRCHGPGRRNGPALNVGCAAACHSPVSNHSGIPFPPSAVSDESQSCLKCHQDNFHRAKAHYPAAAGLCSACHDVSSDHAAGLTKDGATTRDTAATCYSCHSRKDAGKVVHPALTTMGDSPCVLCHDAHGSDQKFFNTMPQPDLCQQCHTDTIPDGAKSIHGLIQHDKSEKGCVNCHNPHSGDNEKMLFAPKEELCQKCHSKDIPTKWDSGNPRLIPNIQAKLDGPHPHPGALAFPCLQCHNPHASTFDRLLVGQYPAAVNEKYAPDTSYALCLSCHKDLTPHLLDPNGDASATNFRNDTVVNGKVTRENLHWFHVVNATGNSDPGKGVSCFACHDPHGSDQDHTIKPAYPLSETQFGSTVYTISATGGSCATSCHQKDEKYFRIDDNPPAAPALRVKR